MVLSPKRAIVWEHRLPAYFGEVRWQGYPGKPAFITHDANTTWYCDASSCKQVTSRDHTLVSYADLPTQGVPPLDDRLASLLGIDLEKIWPWGDTSWGAGWAQGPNANTVAFIGAKGLRVHDLYSGAEQPTRDLRHGQYLFCVEPWWPTFVAMHTDGQLVSVPIRALRLVGIAGKAARSSTKVGPKRGLSPVGDRLLTITSVFRSGHVQVRSGPIGTNVNGHTTWDLDLQSDEITTHARFTTRRETRDYRRKQVTDKAATGRVWVLAAETGDELTHFDTTGWTLQGDSWIGERRAAGRSFEVSW